jgi:hypothetical protein
VKELCRGHGSSGASFCTWRSTFAGMDVSDASAVLRPADNADACMAFFWVAAFGLIVSVVFLVLWLRGRKVGGYTTVRLEAG